MTLSHPTAADLTASLLAALAAAGHPAIVERGTLVFAADGASVPVRVETSVRNRMIGPDKPAAITLDRDGPRRRRFIDGPKSGFDWTAMATRAVEIAAAIKRDREHDAVAERKVARVEAQAAALGLANDDAMRADEHRGRLVLSMGTGSVEATEEQIRAMVGAARACGLVPA